ncbi:MAG: hypothetical protein EZS26_002611 [Candidatus Ordinivivax streblomastigis]|uniref:alpha-L-fucosidase n=1 Tax=Candidatus Ordinivivax streblomastigis TaxID=2540710 RepID=A0A5M8NWJ3_9BACT|nr:MAG: hypothetical protein EZS26_002611 [Candidatus Ordinivivax streblomastigis]
MNRLKKTRTISSFTLALLLLSGNVRGGDNEKTTPYVNPFIGTGAVENSLSGNTYPGATVPFGFIQLSPDTRENPEWQEPSGYDYNASKIYGFSHTHLSGTGVSDFFDVMLMPETDDLDVLAKTADYSSEFSHKNEQAKVGYYSVRLNRSDINAELTATTRTGMHRYTYPAEKPNNLVVDLNHSRDKNTWNTRITESQIRKVDDYTLEGYRVISGWAVLRKVYFYAQFSRPIQDLILIANDQAHIGLDVANGSNMRAVLHFAESKDPLLVKVALSPVSTRNAAENMIENPDWDFDKTVAQADNVWEKELSKIRIEGTPVQKEIFYTALYHAFIQPNTFSDSNGEYQTIDYTTRKLNAGDTHYSTFSLWDSYRATHPLYTLLQPERSADFVNSLLRQYDDYGYLPIWQLWGQENYCMIGNHAIPVIVDAVFKNIRNINVEKAYEAIKNSSLRSHTNAPFDTWEKYGYMPENKQSQSVSLSLEVAYNDWCVAQLAKYLGKTDDYNHFIKRSQFYRNLFNPETKFFWAKDDQGNWIEPFDPLRYGGNGGYPFTEGNAWQYLWYVPHDIPGFIELMGGKQAFEKKLDTFFTLKTENGEKNNNASGFIGQYAHGNEPSHHVAYLYNYVGKPEKAQYYVSKVLNELYNNTSSGYSGNEDCGQMSSWYIFSSMGFYPVNPISGIYVLGSPLLEKAVISLPEGKKFTVKAPKTSAEDIYIQSVKLNGLPYNYTYIKHEDIMKGGLLEFKMGKKPSKTWGIKPESSPANLPLSIQEAPKGKPLTELQQEFVDLKFGMFIHFNIPTFMDDDWADPDASPEIFNPVKLDCSQWAKVAKDASMSYGCLTTKHHSGFCIWDTKTTDYSVMSSPFKKDVVKEYVDAFRKEGLEVMLYYSILDTHHKIRPGHITTHHIDLIKAQLTELLTNYGEVKALIIDGWDAPWSRISYDAVPFEEIYYLIKSLQPNCLVMDLNAAKYPAEALFYTDIKSYEQGAGQHISKDSNRLPALSCLPINSAWFWKQDFPTSSVKSPDFIVNDNIVPFNEVYCNFILNAAPNRDGLIDDNAAESLRSVGKLWKNQGHIKPLPTFEKPIISHNIAKFKSVISSWSNDMNIMDFANDDNFTTAWQSNRAVKQPWLEITLGDTPQSFNLITITQQQNNIKKYRLEYFLNGSWHTLFAGTNNDALKIHRFETVKGNKVRIVIENFDAPPAIAELGIYNEK